MTESAAQPGASDDACVDARATWDRGARIIAESLKISVTPAGASSFIGVVMQDNLLDISGLKAERLPHGTFRSGARALLPPAAAARQDPHERLLDACREAERLIDIPAEPLLQQLSDTFEVNEFSLLDTITERDYVFTKINHRCWEEITSIGMAASGRDYIRSTDAIDQDCIDSGFYDALADCLLANVRKSGSAETGAMASLCQPDFAFGISLTGGNASFQDDIRGFGRDARIIDNIYSSVVLGTTAGLLGFFSSLNHTTRRWSVADGSAPKALFWNCQFGSFIRRIVASSDAILFIVPPRLAGITIAPGQDTPVFRVVVPATNIDTLWGLVAPMLLEHIAKLSERFRLTVLSQCSALSAVLGMMIRQHLVSAKHRSPFRYYDLGQLLDLANADFTDSGFWLTRKDVRNHVHASNDWRDLLVIRRD